MIPAMFGEQLRLIQKFKAIELVNGHVIPEGQCSLQDIAIQEKLRHLAWCITEEIAEAIHALNEPGVNLLYWRTECTEATEAFFEEMADIMHFLIELTIFSGIEPELVENWFKVHDTLEVSRGAVMDKAEICDGLGQVPIRLGLAMNELKFKVWKQNPKPSNEAEYYLKIARVWELMGLIWRRLGCSMTDVYNFYMHKQEINTRRTESGV